MQGALWLAENVLAAKGINCSHWTKLAFRQRLSYNPSICKSFSHSASEPAPSMSLYVDELFIQPRARLAIKFLRCLCVCRYSRRTSDSHWHIWWSFIVEFLKSHSVLICTTLLSKSMQKILVIKVDFVMSLFLLYFTTNIFKPHFSRVAWPSVGSSLRLAHPLEATLLCHSQGRLYPDYGTAADKHEFVCFLWESNIVSPVFSEAVTTYSLQD